MYKRQAITGVTVFGRDITERKRAEQVIQEQLAEITNYYDLSLIHISEPTRPY